MTHDEIVRLLRAVEAVAPVDQWSVGDLRVWPLVRAQISFDNYFGFARRDRGGGSASAATGLRRLAELGRNLARDTRRAWDANRMDSSHIGSLGPLDALLYSDGISFVPINGEYYDRFCDPIREQLAKRGLRTGMVTPLSRFHTPRHSSSFFIQPFLDAAHLAGVARSRLHSRASSFEGWEDAVEAAHSFNRDVTLREPAHYVRAAEHVFAYQWVYGRILERMRPSVVFVVSYYGTEAMSLLRECRRRGITTVDVQHGAITDNHWAYAGWTRLPGDGFDLLPRYFWVWGERESAVIRSWSTGGHHALIGGNLFLEAWRQPGSRLAQASAAQVHEARRHGAHLPLVVYTLSGIESDRQLDRLERAVRSSSASLFWWVRAHPVSGSATTNIADRFSGLASCYFDSAREVSLYGVLQHAAVHVTETSSTTIEAASFGVPTVILSEEGRQMYEYEIKRGWAHVVSPADDLAKVVAASVLAHGESLAAGPQLPDPFDVLFGSP